MKNHFYCSTNWAGKALVAALAGLSVSWLTAGAQFIVMPNFSFESPALNAVPYYQTMPADNGSTVGAWLGHVTFSAVVNGSHGADGFELGPLNGQSRVKSLAARRASWQSYALRPP